MWLEPGGALGFVAAACAGFLGMAALPPIVVMAQEILPTGTGVSSGIVMGLAWAVGSLGLLVTGALADVLGPRTATLACLPILLFAVAFASMTALRRPTDPAGQGA